MPYILAVGHPVPGWKHPLPEGGEFNVDTAGPILKLYFDNPTNDEAINFRFGKVRIGLIEAGLHTLFAIYNIDGVTAGWSDGSYAIGLVPEENRNFEPCADDRGWLVRMLLINANNGVICSMRACTVTPEFSKILDGLIAKQRANLATFTKVLHYREIATAHAKWRTPSAMVKNALIIEDAGQQFNKEPPIRGD